MSGRLDGRTILVTGASRGLGCAAAAAAAEAGARVVGVARSAAVLDQALAALPGDDHVAIAADVTDAGALRTRVADVGPLHGVVAAAGTLGPIGPIGSWDVAAFRQTLDVNVTGALATVLAALDGLRAAGGGSVVTFSGGGATGPLPRFDAYAASKAAVVRLTENLAKELGSHGIRCNSVAPGMIPTDIHQATLAAGPEVVGADYYERTRRAVQEGAHDPPELPAQLVRFLLSDDSRGVTGRLISARWDPWQDPAFQERLRTDADLATLRRIDAQQFFGEPR